MEGTIVKKASFLFGLAAGFLLGSKAGRGPYEAVEGQVRSTIRRPEVRDAVRGAKEKAQDQVIEVAEKVGEKLSSVTAAAG
jgi:hypothetical protein